MLFSTELQIRIIKEKTFQFDLILGKKLQLGIIYLIIFILIKTSVKCIQIFTMRKNETSSHCVITNKKCRRIKYF